MAKTLQSVASFRHGTIEKVETPCKAYSGYVAAVRTYNGIPVIVMAESKTKLIDAVRELNPNVKIDLTMCHPGAVIHERHVVHSIDDDEEL